jgi:hypothetical protein
MLPVQHARARVTPRMTTPVPVVQEAEEDPVRLRHLELLARANLAQVLVARGSPAAWVDVSRRGARCGLSPLDGEAALERLALKGEVERVGEDGWRFRPV